MTTKAALRILDRVRSSNSVITPLPAGEMLRSIA